MVLFPWKPPWPPERAALGCKGASGTVSPQNDRGASAPGVPLAWLLSWGCGRSGPRSVPRAPRGRRTPLQLHPAVCPAGPRGDHPQRCGPRVTGHVCSPRCALGVQWLVCSTGQAPAGCSPRPHHPPVLATRPRQPAQQAAVVPPPPPTAWPRQLAGSTRGALITQEKALGFSGSSPTQHCGRARSRG